jgi:hypothetical protein
MTTTEQILKSKDWRVNNLYKISNKEGQLVTFVRNRAQQHFSENRTLRDIVLKSRQLGMTTQEAVESLDDVLWNPNFNSLMLSYDKESQEEIFDNKVILAWENYRPTLKSLYVLDTDRSNKLKFGFGDGTFSSILVRTRGRSGTYQRLHVSEFAKICKEDPKKAREIISGTIPSVPLGGKITIESTAEGEFGAFADMFWEAWERGDPTKPTEFKAHFYNWQWDDKEISRITEPDSSIPQEFLDYQKKHNDNALSDKRLEPITDIELTYYYYKWLSLNKDWDLLRQEYPTTPEEAFISSGTKFFNPTKLEQMRKLPGEKMGDWVYYREYQPGHRYALGADVAEGVGKDSSSIHIIDFDAKDARGFLKPEVVAEYYSNKIPADLFAYEVKNGGTHYGTCLAAVERNNHGHATLSKLKEIYNNIYTEVRYDKMADKNTEKLGYHTNLATKPKMLYDLKTALNEDMIEVNSGPTIRELRTYDAQDLARVRFDDDQVVHWDRVMSLAITWQMRSHAIPSSVRDPDLRDVDEAPRDTLDRFGVTSDLF